MFREYYFEFNGFNFVSSVDVMGNMYKSIKKLSEQEFIQMNLQCLTELLADTPMNREAILKRLEVMNAGGSEAFISLVVN